MPNRIVLALDGLTLKEVLQLATTVGKQCFALKIHDLVDREGPNAISALKKTGSRIWVDYKLHDVPATVRNRAQALRDNGADIITVHASGGTEMMEAAVKTGITVYAVTVLTSLPEHNVLQIYGKNSFEKVSQFARMAKIAGCQGIVCSPLEVASLARDPELQGMEFVTPGVRSYGKIVHDQVRVDTPKNAIVNGATRLVIGRQITQSDEPLFAFNSLIQEIS